MEQIGEDTHHELEKRNGDSPIDDVVFLAPDECDEFRGRTAI